MCVVDSDTEHVVYAFQYLSAEANLDLSYLDNDSRLMHTHESTTKSLENLPNLCSVMESRELNTSESMTG